MDEFKLTCGWVLGTGLVCLVIGHLNGLAMGLELVRDKLERGKTFIDNPDSPSTLQSRGPR